MFHMYSRSFYVFSDAVGCIGRNNIDHMVGNILHFLFCHFSCSNIQILENLSGIGGDNFTVQLFCNFYTKSCLSACGWSVDDDEFLCIWTCEKVFYFCKHVKSIGKREEKTSESEKILYAEQILEVNSDISVF